MMTAWANRSSGFENQQNQHFERNKHQLAIPTEIIASINKSITTAPQASEIP